MENNYLIKSKIDLPRTQSSIKRLKALKYIIIAYTVLIALDFLMNGFNIDKIKLLILPAAYFLYFANRTADKGGSVFTPVEAILKEDEMILDYSNIDKRDGKGNRKEVISFSYNKIYGLEYNDNLLCLRIAGKPRIQVQFENQKKYPGSTVITNEEDTRIHFLYLDAENAREFLNNLVNLSGLKVENKEQFSSGMVNSEG